VLRTEFVIEPFEQIAAAERSSVLPRRLWQELWWPLFHDPSRPEPVGDVGGRHVVLVVPAALTGDFATRPLRAFLERCGYRPYGWGLGVNRGPTPRLLAGLRRRLRELRDVERGPVSIVGVSLGGLLALDLAYDCADGVCQVTAFFTRADGIVAWESCRSEDSDRRSIEVRGSASHPLSQPRGASALG